MRSPVQRPRFRAVLGHAATLTHHPRLPAPPWSRAIVLARRLRSLARRSCRARSSALLAPPHALAGAARSSTLPLTLAGAAACACVQVLQLLVSGAFFGRGLEVMGGSRAWMDGRDKGVREKGWHFLSIKWLSFIA